MGASTFKMGQDGPVIPVVVSWTAEQHEASGGAGGASFKAGALLDTGSERTFVHGPLVHQLGAQQTGWEDCLSAMSARPVLLPVHTLTLRILTDPAWEEDLIPVIAAPLHPDLGVLVIIGRDLLQHTTLTLHGTNRSFTILLAERP